jgi:poly-beta-1,6-N-acetyl-D-glucosamine synthase
MVPVVLLLFTVYFALLLALLFGWQLTLTTYKTPSFPVSDERPDLITVIVPARNEATNIGNLLDDLGKQDDKGFEVVVVDDHSEDKTWSIVTARTGKDIYPVKAIRLKELYGKKNALTIGVVNAQGSIIMTTDADCRVPDRWVSTIRRCFSKELVKFVAAGVRIEEENDFWSSLQATEFASLIGVGAATIGLGYPTMCNGANMAFRKEVFNEVGGYTGNDNIASGDDEFLIRKVHDRYSRGIHYCPDKSCVVKTKAVSPAMFVAQRLRWAGKWRLHRSPLSLLLAIFIFCFHAAFVALLPVLLIYGDLIVPAVLVLGKVVVEYAFLRRVGHSLGSSWSWRSFGFLQFTYPFYVIIFGIMANLGSVVWKGRKIKHARFEIQSPLAENR